jgi:hypothetical protein
MNNPRPDTTSTNPISIREPVMSITNPPLPLTLLAGAILSLGLASCGGGGGDGSSGTVATAPLNIAGTATTGTPIAGATVQVKCASGSGSGQTDTNGAYSLALSSGALPCVLSVPSGSGNLHSVVEAGSGSSVTANLTPITEALVANLVGSDTTTFFTNFDTSAQAKLTAVALAKAQTNVTAALAGVTDISGLNALKDNLATSPTATNTALNKLATALSDAQLTLAQLDSALAASGSTTDPVKTILQPAAAGCSGLRSGKYQVIAPFISISSGLEKITVDAKTLTVTYSDASTDALADNGGCLFTMPGDGSQLHVAASGLALWRFPASSGRTGVAIIIPEQSIPLGDLAGTWNSMGYSRDTPSGSLSGFATQYTLDGNGAFSSVLDCGGGLGDVCTADTPTTNLVANAQGGYDASQGGTLIRVFPFKAADGSVAIINTTTDGSGLSINARTNTLSQPTVGAVTPYWNVSFGSTGYQSAFVTESTTIASIDTVAGTYTRIHASDGHSETLTLNKPKPGIRYRPAAVAATGSGGTVNVSETVLMRVGGTGLSVARSVASSQNFFAMSIDRP